MDASTFANLLNNLTIRVYDASFANPKSGTPADPTPQLGSAAWVAPVPTFGPFPAPPPPPVAYPAGTTIAQHSTPIFIGPTVLGVDMAAVATAVIQYTPAGPEYPSVNPRPDLRIHFERTGGRTIVD